VAWRLLARRLRESEGIEGKLTRAVQNPCFGVGGEELLPRSLGLAFAGYQK
jgi:hypothetical protein